MDGTPDDENVKGDWSDLTFAIGGIGIVLYGFWHNSFSLILIGAVTATVSFGQWKRQPWSDWGLLGIALLGLPGMIWLGFRFGFHWWRILTIPACAWVIWNQVRILRARHHAKKEADEPMVSFVLWERTPRFLDEKILAQSIQNVWPGDYSGQDNEAPCFIVGESPLFMIRSLAGAFLVHNMDRPYFDNPDEVIESTNDLRTRKSILEHKAWISVDLMGAPSDPTVTKEKIYAQIGRLVAELAGPETLGLLHPERRIFYPWSAELESALQTGQGLKALDETALIPVTSVESDDPTMEAAIAEARRRWPEFVAAFSRRHPEQMFSVKTALSAGERTEHIWLDVKKINGETIHGQVGNVPVDLGDYKLGDNVSISTSEVEDWIYLLTDKPIGGFTIKAVDQANQRKRD